MLDTFFPFWDIKEKNVLYWVRKTSELYTIT